MGARTLSRAVIVAGLAMVMVINVIGCRTRPGANGGLRFGAPQPVAQGLEVPWSMAFVDRDTMIVTERPGRFRLIDNGQLRAEPIGRVSATTAGEGGLMGIALHPEFPAERVLYAYYTAREGNYLVRYPVGQDLMLGAEERLIGPVPQDIFHDGGEIRFGPDGMLYVAIGYGPSEALAADLDSLNGKILRLTPEGDVPADNPFPGSYVWSWGHRNPQGMAWDRAGRMYASEHGPTLEQLGLCCNDELNLIQKGGFYGWPYRAGNTSTQIVSGTPPATPIAPIAISGTNATWAPANMAIWDGTNGTTHLYQANLRGSNLLHFTMNSANPSVVTSTAIELTGYGRLRLARFGPDNCLYLSDEQPGFPGRAPRRRRPHHQALPGGLIDDVAATTEPAGRTGGGRRPRGDGARGDGVHQPVVAPAPADHDHQHDDDIDDDRAGAGDRVDLVGPGPGQLAPPAGRDARSRPANVAQLAPKWVVALKGDISATPTVVGGVAYVPDWGGYLTAVDTRDGSIIWQRPVTDYVVFGGVVSRTSPAVVGDDLVLGFTTKQLEQPAGRPAVGADRARRPAPGGVDGPGEPGRRRTSCGRRRSRSNPSRRSPRTPSSSAVG